MKRSAFRFLAEIFLSLFFFALGFFFKLNAQSPPLFYAHLAQTRLSVGSRTILTISLEGEEVDPKSRIALPDLSPYFRVENQIGPSLRTEMSIINGRMTKKVRVTMQYFLLAVKPGKFTIPSLAQRVGSKIYYTNPIQVEIVEPGTPEPKVMETKGWAPPEDPFLKLVLERSEYYVGEQISASWYIYYQEDLYNLGLGMNPPLSEFKVLDLESPSQLSPMIKSFRGREWKEAFVQSLALFPLHSGKLTIGSLELRVQYPSRRRDFFGMPIIQEVPIRSEPVSVLVKPLPPGAPPDFSGAVGSFSVKARVSQNQVRRGESFKLNLEIRGDGNPDYILEPRLDFPPSFEVYPPEIKLEKEIVAGRLFSLKKFDYLVVPKKEGEFQIPEVSFSYFDPASGEYRWAKGPGIRIRVLPGAEPGLDLGSASRSQSSEIRTDIRFIKPDQRVLRDQSIGMIGKVWFWMMHLFGLVLVGFAFWYRGYQARLRADQGLARKSRAFSQFKKRLKKAKSLAQANDPQLSAELRHSLLEYFGNRFNQSPWGLLEEEIQEILKKEKVPPELSQEFLNLLNELARAQYAGKREGEGEELLRRSESVVQEIERCLR